MATPRGRKAQSEESFMGEQEEESTVQRGTHYKVTAEGKVERNTMSMIDPSDFGLGSIDEPIAMPAGYEAHLRVISVKKGTDKNGNDYLMPLLEVVDEPMAKDFSHFLAIPNRETMLPKQFQRAAYGLQEFMGACEMSFDSVFDPITDWPGSEFWAILGVTESAEYGKQNKIDKFIQPR